MKRTLVVSFLLLAGFAVYLRASVKQGYQTATVVEVKKIDTSPQYSGSNPADAPMQAEEYAYEIGLRLDCVTYFARYESATDYLPSVFAPNKEVDVRLDKHWMYVSLPSDRDVKMGIMRHQQSRNEVCTAKN